MENAKPYLSIIRRAFQIVEFVVCHILYRELHYLSMNKEWIYTQKSHTSTPIRRQFYAHTKAACLKSSALHTNNFAFNYSFWANSKKKYQLNNIYRKCFPKLKSFVFFFFINCVYTPLFRVGFRFFFLF